jgi:O-antigen/teichoic acid export membrane protein
MISFYKQLIKLISLIFTRNKFLGFGFFLTAAQLVSGAFGYLFQILMGRFLSPIDFASFSTVMAAFMFFGAPMVAMSLLIVRKVSSYKANKTLFMIKPLLIYTYKFIFILSSIILLIFWIFSAQLMEYLRINNIIILFLFESVLLLSLFTTVNSSFLQGMQKFTLMASFGLAAVVLKIVFSTGFILFGFALEGALLGIFVSMGIIVLVCSALLLIQLPNSTCQTQYQFKFSSISKIYPVLAATVAAAAMTQLDMVLVNWYFEPKEAGLYAAASVLGKAILYLPGGLIAALFPMVSELHSKGESGLRIFRQAILATILCCGSICLMYWVFADDIIALLYGPNYVGAGQILRWYGFAILPMALVIIAEQYLIAQGQVLFAWIFLAIAPLQILAIYIWHTELWMILLSMGLFGSLLACIGCLFMFFNRRSDNFQL